MKKCCEIVVGVDVDGVLLDLLGRGITLWNQRCERQLHKEEFCHWNFHPTEGECSFWDFLADGACYDKVNPIRGARTGITELRELCTMRFVTDTPPHLIKGKVACLQRHGFVDSWKSFSEELIIMKDKRLFRGDVLIDDNPANLADFEGMRILFHAPWNKADWNNSLFFHAKDWEQVVMLVEIALRSYQKRLKERDYINQMLEEDRAPAAPSG